MTLDDDDAKLKRRVGIQVKEDAFTSSNTDSALRREQTILQKMATTSRMEASLSSKNALEHVKIMNLVKTYAIDPGAHDVISSCNKLRP